MKLALIPLDERPVNTRYPRMIAEIAGMTLTRPPVEILSNLRNAGQSAALLDWLLDQVGLDALIVSIEMLGYGGLIASRINGTPTHEITNRLGQLGAVAAPIYGFNVITRIPDADYAIEEPDYWNDYGRRIHRYSQLMHQTVAGQDVRAELGQLRAEIPFDYLQDFTRRRLRNHQINLYALGLAARGSFKLLVISSDDTSEYGLGTQEKAWIAEWVRRLGLSDQRVLMYPGADEVGCVLLLRAFLDQLDETPNFYVHYAIEADKERIAPYEDSPVRVTVERQIKAIGGVLVADLAEADYVVAVNPPSGIGQEYDPEAEHFESEQRRRSPNILAFTEQIAAWVASDKRVIVCDVAYPNGSDPDLIAHLLAKVDLSQMAAYGAWNTAGNTIGTALAQGVASAYTETEAQREAQQRFLLHRFIEDWGYQHLVREQTRDWLEATFGQRDPAPEQIPQTLVTIGKGLAEILPQLGRLSDGWEIKNLRLPWGRTFEIDFDLVKNDE